MWEYNVNKEQMFYSKEDFMEGDVKALINLKERTIELVGPQKFVEKYLDQYSSFIEKWKTSDSVTSENRIETKEEKKKGESKKTRISAKSGCSERIRALMIEDYFSESRGVNDIVVWLKDQKSVTYQTNQVSAALSAIIKSTNPKIRRFKEGGVYKYCNI